MRIYKKVITFIGFYGCLLGAAFALAGCAELNNFNSMNLAGSLPKTQEAYEKKGNEWGTKLREKGYKPATNLMDDYKKDVCGYVLQKNIDKASADQDFKENNAVHQVLDRDLVRELFKKEIIDYFNVHSELKDSFKKGFRLGYQDRIADLVLGPYLTTTAACKGMSTSQDFVDVIKDFEGGWAEMLNEASRTFVVLISEGSQADRENFIGQFIAIYGAKWHNTNQKKQMGGMRLVSDGGTTMYIDMREGAAGALMDIPHQNVLKELLYTQAFIVMGDEWGRRYATNLIKRDELVDLLRRVKPVLSEIGNDRENLARIYEAFKAQYDADKDAFRSMLRDSGIDVAMLHAQAGTAGHGSKKR